MTQTTPRSPKGLARGLAALLDTLLPGDDLFPPASIVGTTGLVFDRLRLLQGEHFVQQVLEYLDRVAAPRDFAELPAAERAQCVTRLEQEHPDWFEQIRFAAYLSYYQLPPVVRAVRALGFDYNEAPQPAGYHMEPFDPQHDLPTQPRGHYVPTASITRCDLSGLGDLLQTVEY